MSSPARAGALPEPVEGRIAVVGPCGSGKSTLVANLSAHGYDARQCAQEHSYVAEMWQRLSRPEVLVYLDVSSSVAAHRCQANYSPDYFQKQRQRLRHARQHSKIYVHTDALSEEGVLTKVITALTALGTGPAHGVVECHQPRPSRGSASDT